VIAVIQAHDQTPYFKMKVKDTATSAKEIRNMAYQAIANGAGGVIFWAIHAGKYDLMAKEKRWAALKRVAANLRDNYDMFVMPDSGIEVDVEPPDAPVDFLVKAAPGGGYRVIALNYSRKSVNVSIALEEPAARAETAADRRIELDMKPLGVRILDTGPGDDK